MFTRDHRLANTLEVRSSGLNQADPALLTIKPAPYLGSKPIHLDPGRRVNQLEDTLECRRLQGSPPPS
jgi:hypothetical protein